MQYCKLMEWGSIHYSFFRLPCMENKNNSTDAKLKLWWTAWSKFSEVEYILLKIELVEGRLRITKAKFHIFLDF